MKKAALICLVMVVAIGLCACRTNREEETTPTTTTEPATEPPTKSVPDPTVADPSIMDPTIAPNIPDPNVDDDHLIDPTDGNNTTENKEGLIPDIGSGMTSAS